MKLNAQTFAIVTGLTVFILAPLPFYILGDAPRRSVLKESLSILTLLAFTLMLGQFFLARSNEAIISLFKPLHIQRLHKYIAYGAVAVILLHPYLIVLPRHFEAGVKPWDAFITLLTTFDSIGVIVGIAAWMLLLVLSLTAIFRMNLIKRLGIKYRSWRYFHGFLSVTFISLAIWHAIDLGRHTDMAMSAFYIFVALVGVGLLARLYWGAPSKRASPAAPAKGVKA